MTGAARLGRVVLAGTPIGDRRDASSALVECLQGAELIAAEDTRAFALLLKRLGIETRARVVSHFDGNEAGRTPELLEVLRRGTDVVVVSDAGMPLVSDPGYRLVRAALDAGAEVTAVPGPSAVLTALAVSGLPVDRFCFEGFLPRKGEARRRRLDELAAEPRTMVFFEAPHRLAQFLTDAAAALGDDRPAAVCRELTKQYEEVRRGGLAELAAWALDHARGEITVVVAGRAADQFGPDDALALVRARMADGEKLSAAVTEVAAMTGAHRKQLYQAALADRAAASEESR
ncbi:16S rRNA (cytidine(1402)-2'-O)-methyltransferase [Aestuariimicrobium ganziense]|uniref:16S rRNA (cytidine(1402)-2'-O)-methyltransferase n=1 Tax=Aestuariimicrobium ganziense TaxID=2773677 RepID=UPI0019440A49|nr:16S rRNA (cytidine(1402)-2'-O)-methyltransferase [Aestuariimicrobium ganziense]